MTKIPIDWLEQTLADLHDTHKDGQSYYEKIRRIITHIVYLGVIKNSAIDFTKDTYQDEMV